MATIRKRIWDSPTGKKSAWVVTYTDANRKRRLETFSLLESAEARREEILSGKITAIKMTDGTIVHLRVSIARIAQAAELDEYIPGANGRIGLPFEELIKCAQETNGWNNLCGLIVEKLEDYHRLIRQR